MSSLFSLSDPCITSVVLACYLPKDFRGNLIHKDRPSHGLAYLAEGKNRYTFSDGTDLILQKGEILYLPKGSTYTVERIEETECYAINFQLASEEAFAPRVLPCKDRANLIACFSRAAAAWERADAGYLMQICAVLYEILFVCHQIEKAPQSRCEIPYAIRNGVSYLNEHYTDPDLTVCALAQRCHVSETHFRTLFCQAFGMPPVRYLNQRRMDFAKQLLIAHEHTVAEIQQLCGFRDACRFSREFKKFYGCAPSVFSTLSASG
jgi:AraC-like DNA-binding protein